jgi:hypothetical protein
MESGAEGRELTAVWAIEMDGTAVAISTTTSQQWVRILVVIASG